MEETKMNPILTDYNKIIEGCKEYYSLGICGRTGLCPSCSKAKQVFLQRCQSELEFCMELEGFIKKYEDEYYSIYSQGYKKVIERISQLKEVLQKDG